MTTASTPAPARIHVARDRPSSTPTKVEGPPLAFHKTMPGYARTRVVALPDVADDLGVGELWVKDESERLGLPSFKVLGGSWAIHRLLSQRAGEPFARRSWEDLLRLAERLAPMTLCAATDGNHGRGVARVARLLSLDAVLFVPDDMTPARQRAIRNEGATVVVVDGDYDDAVARAARESAENGWEVVADVAYAGYQDVPRWVVDGYDTIFEECDEQLPDPPDVVFVQVGVGALAGATVRHYTAQQPGTRFAMVEPLQAACVLESSRAGIPVALESSKGSIMAGLNCGTPSTVTWPVIFANTDVYVAIPDSRTIEAMRLLADHDVESGESGAAGLGGLLEVAEHPAARGALRLDHHARVLLINTEGATDPDAYRDLVGRR